MTWGAEAVGGWWGGRQPRCTSFLAFLGRAAGRWGRGGGGRAAGMQTPERGGGEKKGCLSAAARQSPDQGCAGLPAFPTPPCMGVRGVGVPGDGVGGGPGGLCDPVWGDALTGPVGQKGCSCTPASAVRLP